MQNAQHPSIACAGLRSRRAPGQPEASHPWSARIEAAFEGPVEHWLAAFLDRWCSSSSPLPGLRVAGIALCSGARPADFRVSWSWPGSTAPSRAEWKSLTHALASLPLVCKAVAVPPCVYLTLAPEVIAGVLAQPHAAPASSHAASTEPGAVVVFCSPNTNKPLHIGHLRACFLGMSLARLFETAGIPVRRSQMLSNFGVHMCQALTMYDREESPLSLGLKPDWFVGDLYRRFHAAAGAGSEQACDGARCEQSSAPPCLRCRSLDLLQRMVEGDEALLAHNRRLGEWAIEGILATQSRIGTSHDSSLRESEVLGIAVEAIHAALTAGVCRQREDGSIYIDIHDTGGSELTLLRHNGTSLVYSMLLGIYLSRSERYPGWSVIELTGEQWRAGRRCMYELLERIGRGDIAKTTEGVFFGMVQLGDKTMSSRRGNVVLIDELVDRIAARVRDSELVQAGSSSAAANDALAVALLKYHILGFGRADGFDFDEDHMWTDTLERVQGLRWLLGQTASNSEQATSAPLALALARQRTICKRALLRRDPALLVRYLDELVGLARRATRKGEFGPHVPSALRRIVSETLALLDLEPHVLVPLS